MNDLLVDGVLFVLHPLGMDTVPIVIAINVVLMSGLIALIIYACFFQNSNSDEGAKRKRHPLDVNTLEGHGDSVNGLCFSSDGHSLATVCDDGAVRVFKLDDANMGSSIFRTFIFPIGCNPCGVSISDNASSFVVACRALVGSSLNMYTEEKPKAADSKQQPKLPRRGIKWAHQKVHGEKNIITLFGTKATYGNGDGSTILASSSEETDIIIWHGKTGKILGSVDTNQLKNNMAIISPNGRFVAAATFTADVKVWEIVYSKDSSVKDVSKVMQLKGHKTTVTWLCFSPNSEQIITASKDGTIRIWNINVRYHLDEGPKTVNVFHIPLHDSEGNPLHYNRISISPDGKILAATHGSTLQWLCIESGRVLDTAEKAHDGDITGIEWAPKPISMGDKKVLILATASTDNKVKLWEAPSF